MANIRQAFEYAAKNPNSDFAKNLGELAKSGSLNVEAKKNGIDLSPFQTPEPTTQPTAEPVKKEPTFAGEVIRDVVKPFARLATNAGNAMQMIAGQETTQPFSGEYLGEVTPVGQSGNFGKDIKDSLGTALEVASTVSGGGATKGIVKTGVKQTLKNIAINSAKEGAVIGATQGAGSSILNGEGVIDTVKNTATSALLGGGLGGTIGIVGKGASNALEKIKAQRALNHAAEVDNLAGKIVQGTPEDIATAKKALSSIETSKIKTYKDLTATLDEKIGNVSRGLDETLDKSPIHNNPLKISDMDSTIKVGDQTIRHNYVDDAFNQLDELYTKTNDIKAKAKLDQLRVKGETQGITIKEINNLAKEHGQMLNAFNANGQAASGLTKQAAENTRVGLKTTARDIFDDPVYKATDTELTNLIRTRDLVENVATNVNKLQQKITERKFGEKVGRLVFQVANTLTGGGLKGFVQSFVPRGEGLKIMNALDLERALGKNLQQLQKALDAKTESEVTNALQSILKSQSSAPFLKSQPTTNIINKTSNIPTTIPSTSSSSTKLSTRIKNTPNKQGGFIKIGSKTFKAIDAPTKSEMVKAIDYIRNKQPFDKTMELDIGRLAEKYGISSKSLTDVAKKFEDLIDKTKTTK